MLQNNNLVERPQYIKWLRELRDQNLIKVIKGVRRSGKSTLLQMFADELLTDGVDSSQIHHYNFEDPETFAIGDYLAVYRHINELLVDGKTNYIFLDEVQNVKDFERLVDGLFIKPNCDVYITGSNAYMLSGELATLLTGRYLELDMYPLSYKEWNSLQSETSEKLSKSESFRKFLYQGGLPEAITLGKVSQKGADAFVRSIQKTIIEKDIFKRKRVNNKTAFYKIIDFLMDSIGSEVSPKSISDYLKANSVDVDDKTVSAYLRYLSDSLLFYKTPRYEIKGKGLLQTLDKYYVSDSSFRRVTLGKNPDQDQGHLLENAVFFELKRRYQEVYIGKIGAKEVDFIALDFNGVTDYYQVSWSTEKPETLTRELASLQDIKDSHPKFLITMDYDFHENYDGIKKINAVDWFLE
jgi:predicted AAA+ superfamily ATPase